MAENNKCARNLQEQVLENMRQIAAMKYGIKIVEQVDTVPELPETPEIGEAVAVGTEYPYYFYVKIGDPKTYINIGTLQGPEGDVGPEGAEGIQGERGSLIFTGYREPTKDMKPISMDLYLNTLNGDLYQYLNDEWKLLSNIKGPQGIMGQRGYEGIKGDKGDVGPQGPVGPAIKILGRVATTDDLPSPDFLDRNSAYLVGQTSPYDIYVIMGIEKLYWIKLGEFTNIDLGETEGTAYEGSKGKANAEAITALQSDVALKENYQGIKSTEGLDAITDKKSFYKYFFDKRNLPTQNYIIEGGTEQSPTNENVITALGGFPEGFKRKAHWFILVNFEGNTNNHNTNGFALQLLIRGSVEDDFYKMYMHSYNGTNGTFDSGWINIKAITKNTADIEMIKKNFTKQHEYIGNVESNELFNWATNTPGVDTGELFYLIQQDQMTSEGVAHGFPEIVPDTVIYGFYDATNASITIWSTYGIYTLTEGSPTSDAFKKGSDVVANPTLSGSEEELTGIGVNGINYKMPAGGGGGGLELIWSGLFDFPHTYDKPIYEKIKKAKKIYVDMGSGIIATFIRDDKSSSSYSNTLSTFPSVQTGTNIKIGTSVSMKLYINDSNSTVRIDHFNMGYGYISLKLEGGNLSTEIKKDSGYIQNIYVE